MTLILLILAFACFILAAIPVAVKIPVQLVPMGLALWVLTQILAMT